MPVRNSANFLINPQIAKLLISTKYCKTQSQTSPKSRLLHNFFFIMYTFYLELYMLYLEGKVIYLRTGGRFKSANHKKLGPQNANPQRVTSADGPQI
jgi:hypothetical protein